MSGDPAFEFRASKDERVFLYHRGRLVETLTGRDAVRFLARVRGITERGSSEERVQLLIAKATKNFKRGNERR